MAMVDPHTGKIIKADTVLVDGVECLLPSRRRSEELRGLLLPYGLVGLRGGGDAKLSRLVIVVSW